MRTMNIIRFQEVEALEFYVETPKTVTAVTHADETDDSEFHCIWMGYNCEGLLRGGADCWPYCVKKVFTVPRQKIELLMDPVYGKFYLIKVIPQFTIPLYPGEEFWLIAQTNGRSGFLVPLEALEDLKKDEKDDSSTKKPIMI